MSDPIELRDGDELTHVKPRGRHGLLLTQRDAAGDARVYLTGSQARRLRDLLNEWYPPESGT